MSGVVTNVQHVSVSADNRQGIYMKRSGAVKHNKSVFYGRA
jgi:hypothetical protein